MKLCRVIDPIVSSVKHPTYEGLKLLLVQQLDEDLKEKGPEFIAVDRVQAGEGDLVLVMQEGNGVRQLFKVKKLPIRSIIVGIVDEVHCPK